MVVALSPMKRTLTYDQLSCQLRVEGLPDLSAGQAGDELGILTGWSLRWAGRPELEGQRHHLEALIASVLPYARHLVSGLRQGFGDRNGPVWIGPADGSSHMLRLVSGQSGNPSLDLQLDDAELADLVRVLDQLRLDPRVKLPLEVPAERPLRSSELISRIPLQRRLAAPIGGMAALALAAALAAVLPPPPRQSQPAAAPTAKATPSPSSPAGAAPSAPSTTTTTPSAPRPATTPITTGPSRPPASPEKGQP
mgnify:FL=1